MIRKRKIGPGAPPFKTDRGQTGYVPNVVFTCGAVLEEDGPVKIYWGGADTVMCVGTAKICDLVSLCLLPNRPHM